MVKKFQQLLKEEKSFVSDEMIKESSRLGFEFREISETQMRKFFNQIRVIQRKKENLILQLRLLQAQIAYAVGRAKVTKVSPEFKEFFDLCVHEITNGAPFDEFVKFYEAMYGYFYYWVKLKEEVSSLNSKLRKERDIERRRQLEAQLDEFKDRGLIDEKGNLKFKKVI